VVRRG